MKDELKEIGLSKNESAVYFTLLRIGASSIGKISEHSGVHRRNVYDVIERLGKKGLICQTVKERIKQFKAASPMNLLHIIEEDRERLKTKEEKTKSVASELLSAYNRSLEKKTNVTLYKGIRGIRTVLQDILNTGKENRVLGAHTPPDIIASYIVNFHDRRIRLGIRDRLIFNNDFKRARALAKMPHTEVKLMPKKQERTTCINIYGNKVAVLSWSEPISIIIENKGIADNFRYYFDTLWSVLK